MTRKALVLAAFPPLAFQTLREIIDADVEVIPVSSMTAAEKRLREVTAVELVLCGVHFDDSRMFDLLRHVQRDRPSLPFLCCRILDSEIPQISREAIGLAASSMGAAGFADLPTLTQELGIESAQQCFRALVLAQLEPRSLDSGIPTKRLA